MKLTNIQNIRRFLVVLSVSVCCVGLGWGDKHPVSLAEARAFWVQIAAPDSEPSAQQIIVEFARLHPDIQVSLDRSSALLRIRVGPYRNYVQALLAREDLRANYKGAFVVPADSTAQAFVDPRHPIKRVFETPTGGADQHAEPSCSLSEEQFGAKLHSLAPVAADTTRTLAACQKWLNTLPKQDALRGRIKLRMGYVYAALKDEPKELESFLAVARGEEAATSQMRILAMARAGYVLMRKGDRLAAYKAFCELEGRADTTETMVMAHVHQAALLMELARSKKGRLADCRDVCDEATSMALSQPGLKKYAAIAQLMKLETYYFEGNRNQASQVADQMLASYSEFTREYVAVQMWKANILREQGNVERAEELYEAIAGVSMDASPSNMFADWREKKRRKSQDTPLNDPRAKAAWWLVHLAHKRNDTATVEKWTRFLQQRYPGYRGTEDSSGLLKSLVDAER